jgi:chromosome partitioning protein
LTPARPVDTVSPTMEDWGVNGEDLKALRERLGLTQAGLAAWLNERTGRRYDRQRVGKWETGREPVPREVAGIALVAALPAPVPGAPAITVAVTLQKGGTGKTVTSVNLAHILARAGHRVLLVDADSQGNATLHVGLEQTDVVQRTRDGKTLYHALTGKTPLSETIVNTGDPNLDLVPSSVALAAAESDLRQDVTSAMTALDEVLEDARKAYGFIIVDCAPAVGVVTLNALATADFALIPCQTEPHAIIGLEHLYDTIAKVRKRNNPRLEILGIVPTMYGARQSQDRASLDDIKRLWGGVAHVFEPIPRSTVYAQAAAAGIITLAGDPGAPGLETYVEIARRLIAATEGRAGHGA